VGNLTRAKPVRRPLRGPADVLGFTAGVRYFKQLYHFYGYVGLSSAV
jgi:hypothetical protein